MELRTIAGAAQRAGTRRSGIALAVLALTLGLALATPPAHARGKHATYIRPVLQTVPATGLTQVVVENLVGPITVQTSEDNQVKVDILVHGGGMDDNFAQALAGQLNFDINAIGPQLRIIGNYPLDHFRDYGYPYMKSVTLFHGTDTNQYHGETVHIRDVHSKKAVELWAEIRLTIPSNLSLVIRNIYGDVTLKGFGPAGSGSFDGFTDVGDFLFNNPRWDTMTVQSDYGKVSFPDGFGAARKITVKTDVGGCYLTLAPGASGRIIASKDLGFLHNNFSDAKFDKREDGDYEMVLGDGKGTQFSVDMNIGSLHLERAGGEPE